MISIGLIALLFSDLSMQNGCSFFEGQIRGGIPYGVKEEKMSVLYTERCGTGLGGNRYRS